MRKLRLIIRGPETTSFPIRSILFENVLQTLMVRNDPKLVYLYFGNRPTLIKLRLVRSLLPSHVVYLFG